MSKPNSVYSPVISSLAFVMTCLLSAVITAQPLASEINAKSNAAIEKLNLTPAPQKGPEVVAGAPLKGVDVKLGKNPGGSPAARTTTDTKGKFNFGVVPAGSYTVTLDLPDESKNSKEKGLSAVNVKLALVRIDGAVGGPIKVGWDFKQRESFPSTAQSAKTTGQKTIVLESNGHDPLTGIVETAIVKSKSNITNN